jgi:hypothetical protein
MIMSNSIEALNYVKEDLPLLCIAAIFQKAPQVLISHGAMTDARWKSFYETMAGAGVLTQGLDPRSLEFVNKGIGA